MKAVCRIAKRRWPVTSRFKNAGMRVKHNLSAPPRSPADGFGIAPSLVADDDAKRRRTCREDMTLRSDGGINALLGRIELDFVLPTRESSIWAYDACGDLTSATGHPLHSYDRGDFRLADSICDCGHCCIEDRRVNRLFCFSGPSVPGDEAFRETDNLRVRMARLFDARTRQRDRVRRAGRHSQIRKGNPNCGHEVVARSWPSHDW